jgi:hypothetical protein
VLLQVPVVRTSTSILPVVLVRARPCTLKWSIHGFIENAQHFACFDDTRYPVTILLRYTTGSIMSAAIEIPTIRTNGSEDDNDSFLPDDENEDYLPLVGGDGQPNKNYDNDDLNSAPNKFLSLLYEYKQKIIVVGCIVFLLVCASVLMPNATNGMLYP